jgi:hypothetical protein
VACTRLCALFAWPAAAWCGGNPQAEQSAVGLQACPRQFTGWTLEEGLETGRYLLALCRRGEELYLVGHEKGVHEAFVEARVMERLEATFRAEDEFGFVFEVLARELRVSRDGRLVSSEPINRSEPAVSAAP